MNVGLQLLVNGNRKRDHAAALDVALKTAMRLDCMVAFAKPAGFKTIQDKLVKRIHAGCRVRIIVGLDLFVTHPSVLSSLLTLALRNKQLVEVYATPFDPVKRRTKTFHPKIFSIADGKDHPTVIVGSANLTNGGLFRNIEASVVVAGDRRLAASVGEFLEDLVENKEVRTLKSSTIQAYALAHAKYTAARKRAEEEAGDETTSELGVIDLEKRLKSMRQDKTDEGFDNQTRVRRISMVESLQLLKRIARGPVATQTEFKQLFERYLDCVKSSGLHRKKAGVVRQHARFSAMVRVAQSVAKASPGHAYDAVNHELQRIHGAGVNLATEILQAINPKQFAVMNKNSIAGLNSTGASGFPKQSTKSRVDGKAYAAFCEQCMALQKRLGLKNLSELDALFNYDYWLT